MGQGFSKMLSMIDSDKISSRYDQQRASMGAGSTKHSQDEMEEGDVVQFDSVRQKQNYPSVRTSNHFFAAK